MSETSGVTEKTTENDELYTVQNPSLFSWNQLYCDAHFSLVNLSRVHALLVRTGKYDHGFQGQSSAQHLFKNMAYRKEMNLLETARLSPLAIEGSFTCPFSFPCEPKSGVQKLVIVMAPAQN